MNIITYLGFKMLLAYHSLNTGARRDTQTLTMSTTISSWKNYRMIVPACLIYALW